jgi:hypothetical protein
LVRLHRRAMSPGYRKNLARQYWCHMSEERPE